MLHRLSVLTLLVLAVAGLARGQSGGAGELGTAKGEPVRIGIAGDSTARDYTNMSDSYRELRGWGQYLGESVPGVRAQVLNHGKGGCSSKSFINEGRWEKLLADGPDVVLIQFGHNDVPNKGPERETLADEMPETLPEDGLGSDEMDWFRHNMRTYIRTAREAGVVPIVVTPMERRSFTSNGKNVREKNKPWADAAIAVARELDAAVIDMNAYSIEMMNEKGLEGTLYMHPTREGELDNTHYNEAGARVYAEFIGKKLAELLPQVLPRPQREPAA